MAGSAALDAALDELRSLPPGRAVYMSAGGNGNNTGSGLLLRCEGGKTGAIAALEEQKIESSTNHKAKKKEGEEGKLAPSAKRTASLPEAPVATLHALA